jgi:KUP system potassium uptake protein
VGQIYAPAVNAVLFVAVIAIVVGFGSATALASAYGVAVTGTFLLNTVLFLAVARLLWHKRKAWIAFAGFAFLTVEAAFFAANLTKIVHGGWLPLAIAALIFTLLMTWRKGREIVTRNRYHVEGSLREFVEHLGDQEVPVRAVAGVSVFLNPTPESTPLALRANVEHNHVLHEHVILVSMRIERVPHVPDAERVLAGERVMFSGATGDPLAFADRFTMLTLRFGFQDEPDIPTALRLANEQQLIEGSPDLDEALYFLSQITIVPTNAPGLAAWRKKLFVTMARNAANPAEYFRLPDSQTVTMSGRIDL